MEVPSANAEVLSNAFAQGLKKGHLFRSLAKKPAFSFDNLLARVEKYVNMEEAAMMKGAESLPPNKDGKNAKFVPRRPRAKDRRPEERRYTQFMC
ncbi:hypothetical protein BUALT_Bualt13G0063900 [Buddleja alternifolia]|uniref:Uncharacterized protein n=1 Tax=Buddleja alternifolia TaxID=168488 RepID=A0AAV6WW65_9LAMI|nr:hypothetical protein BUALT_Bualt13G0063900 [Buddleja alternifolia]